MGLASIKVNCRLISTNTQVIKAISAFLLRVKFALLDKNVSPVSDENIGIDLPDWNRQVVARPFELSTFRAKPSDLYCELEFTPPLEYKGRQYSSGFCTLFRQNQPDSPWQLSEYFVLATHWEHFLGLTSGERDTMLKV